MRSPGPNSRWVVASLSALVGLALFLIATRSPIAPREAQRTDDVRRRLEALGYAETVGPRDAYLGQTGVTTYDPARTADGINVYCSEARDEVHFLNMKGEPVQILELPGKGSPSNECLPVHYGSRTFAVLNAPEISLIDAASGVTWSRVGRFHHDIATGPRGELYTFEGRPRTLRHNGLEIEIHDHVITILSPDGEPEREINLFDLFGDQIPRWRLNSLVRLLRGEAKIKATPGIIERRRDVFHPNSIEYIETPPPGMEGADLLISLRSLDQIAFVDSKREKVIWSWGAGSLDRQHHPTLLPNGNILVFDNGMLRGWSRVIELDPVREEVVWEYRAPGFFSAGRGGAELLPNGNVLITESGRGRVFEITREGDLVWEFLNPIFDHATGERATIYRMFRMSSGEWARAASAS